MPVTIIGQSPTGGANYEAAINENKRLLTSAVQVPTQRHLSEVDRQMYRASFAYTISGAGNFVIAALTNTDAQGRDCLLFEAAYQWWSLAGAGTPPPSAANYVTAIRNMTFSGGDAVTTVMNLHLGSPNAVPATLLQNNPTVIGTPIEGQEAYLLAVTGGGSVDFSGALVIPAGVALGMRLYTDNTSGTFNMLMSFGWHTPGID